MNKGQRAGDGAIAVDVRHITKIFKWNRFRRK